MNSQPLCTSTCRLCSYYQPEGRRGGVCQQLGVPVKGCWKACSLAVQPFAHGDWVHLGQDIAHLEQSLVSSPKTLSTPHVITPLEAIADEFYPDHLHRQEETLSA